MVVFSLSISGAVVEHARLAGASGALSKALPAHELIDAIDHLMVDDGFVIARARTRWASATPTDWPGRADGLTERESDIVDLASQRPDQRRDQRASLPQPGDGQDPLGQGPAEAGPPQPHRSRAPRRPPLGHGQSTLTPGSGSVVSGRACSGRVVRPGR